MSSEQVNVKWKFELYSEFHKNGQLEILNKINERDGGLLTILGKGDEKFTITLASSSTQLYSSRKRTGTNVPNHQLDYHRT